MADYLCPVLATSLPVAGCLMTGYLTRNVKPKVGALPSFTLPPRIAAVYRTSSLAGMGYGSSLIYREFNGINGDGVAPLALYGTTLLLDSCAAPLLLKTKSTKLVTVAQTAALGTAVASFVAFYKVNHKAAYFMLPYLLWVLYKTCLHVSIMRNSGN